MAAVTPETGSDALDRADATATRVHRLGIDGRPVPVLRGRIHQVSAPTVLVAGAAATVVVDGALPRVALAIFTAGAVAMLAASALYHCHAHSFERKLVARRLDHAMIFVAIAGSMTAFWLLTAPGPVAAVAIAVVWGAAGLGMFHKIRHLTLQGSTGSWLYGVLGATGALMLPFLVDLGDPLTIAVVVAGGAAYTAGGVIFGWRLLDPWPRVFGFHEVWHLLVVVGVFTHFAGVLRLAATVG